MFVLTNALTFDGALLDTRIVVASISTPQLVPDTMSFAALPAELQLRIITESLEPQVSSSSSSARRDIQQALTLTVVSRSCNATVTEWLYRHIRVCRAAVFAHQLVCCRGPSLLLFPPTPSVTHPLVSDIQLARPNVRIVWAPPSPTLASPNRHPSVRSPQSSIYEMV